MAPREQPMPSGTYYGVVGNLRAGKAGLTSALLRRYELINQRLAADGRRMTLLTFSEKDKDDVAVYGLTDGVDVLNVERHGGRTKSPAGWIDWLTELSARATGENPIHFICDGHEVGAVVSKALSPLPHVYFIQAIHNPSTSAKYAPFRESAIHADAIVCATQRQATLLRTDGRHGGTASGKVPVHTIGFPRRSAARPGARNDRRIVMLTRVGWQKDIELAVESFHELLGLARRHDLARHEDLVLDIYGALERKGEVARVRAAIDRHDLTGRVTLRGYTSGAVTEFGSSSITWLTSRFEGWGLAITEAQQAGCIPIVIDEPFGPREQIEHGVDGFLVRAPAAQWLRRQEAKRHPGRSVRVIRNLGRRVITPLSVHMARETLRALEMEHDRVEAVRAAAVRRVESPERSPETYVDSWIRVIESVVEPRRASDPS